jgi:hypothetical protein
MRAIVADIIANAPVETTFGRLPADDTEVNGDLLQVLGRLYRATGDRSLLEQAVRIVDAYCGEVMKTAPLPAHRWDFTAHRPVIDQLSLNDHGNEIVGGLAEVFFIVGREDPAKAAAWEPVLRRMFDTLLATMRNPDGLWYSRATASTGEPVAKGTPDTWGYALGAVYTFGLATGDAQYREAVAKALAGINQPAYHDWGGADSFADSIESGLLLYNRMPAPETAAWLDVVAPKFLAKQREDGIVEGWHGDGNFCRTALMLAFHHSQGAWLGGWREDLRLGAVQQEGRLHLAVEADEPWSGRVHFDTPRHREVLNLPADYARLNQFPEWFTVDRARLYQVEAGGETQVRSGEELVRGLPVTVQPGAPQRLIVSLLPGPPYGTQAVRLQGPTVVGGDGPVEVTLTVRNDTAEGRPIRLTTDWGQLAPAELDLAPGAEATVRLTGQLDADRTAVIAVAGAAARLAIKLVRDPNLTGLADLAGETYAEETYAWTGNGPISATLSARRGQPHRLRLRWGAKGDVRRGVVTIGGREFPVERGGYDGWEWVDIAVPAELVTGDSLTVQVRAVDPQHGAPFLSELRLVRGE